MNEKQYTPSRFATIKLLLAAIFLIVPLVAFHFLSLSPMLTTIVRLVFIAISVLLYRSISKDIMHVSTQSLPILPVVVRVFSGAIALSIPAIAGYFLEFSYIVAFLVAVLSFFVASPAVVPWFEKMPQTRGDLFGAILLVFFFVAFGFFSGDWP